MGSTANDPSLNYERIEADIGEGTYGKVHKARDKRDGALVAIKKLKSDTSKEGIHFTSLREIKVMRGIYHENLMDLRDVYIQHGHVCLVMPYMSTDLRNVIEECNKKQLKFEERHIKNFALQITRGLAALHANWFLHRDLTPGNVMINASGVAKIGDFGLTRQFGSPDKPLTPVVVTLWYRPPELLFQAKAYSEGVDIWSLGCIIGELTQLVAMFRADGELDMMGKIFMVAARDNVTGTPTKDTWPNANQLPHFIEFTPWPGKKLTEVLPNAGPGTIDFLQKILINDPNKRPSAEELLKDGWFKNSPKPCENVDLKPFLP